MANTYIRGSWGGYWEHLMGAQAVSLTAQTATITTTTMYATVAGAIPPGAGIYRVSWAIICTTAGTGGTVSLTLGWNNGTLAMTFTSTTLSLTATGELDGLQSMYVAAPQNITYATTVAGAVGAPQYALYLRLEWQQ